MAVNQYFSNHSSNNEQALVDALVTEAISIYGHNCYYVPRTLVNENDVYNEAEEESFDAAYSLEFYIKSFDSFAGEGTFLSAYGIEIRDELVLTVSITTFATYVTGEDATITRPREGDIIYIPMIGAAYQIKRADKRAVFYQMGALQSYDLTCQLYEYSNDTFNTGVSAIDDKYNAFAFDNDTYELRSEANTILTTEAGGRLEIETYIIDDLDPFADNEEFQDRGETIIDFSERNPFSQETY